MKVSAKKNFVHNKSKAKSALKKSPNKMKQQKSEKLPPSPLDKVSTPIVTVIRKRKLSSSDKSSSLPGVENFWNTEKPVNQPTQAEPSFDKKSSKKTRLTGAEQYKKFIDEEERVRKVEEELADPNSEPKTPDQFERKLLCDRNSSFLWIKYMAFYLETAEVTKARNVVKKAIATINFREENELLNVWMAYLNLEIKFGSMDSYQEVLREATQRNDAFQVHMRALKILLESEKFDEANKTVDILRKKYRPKAEMWLQVAEAYLVMKNEKMAKEMLPKSLLSLREQERMYLMHS